MKSKQLLWIALPLAAILVLAIWYFIPRQPLTESANPSQQKQPPLVKVEPVRVAAIASTLELTGEVVASNSTVISTMKEGRIELCSWREGDTVESGEMLVVIDREVYRTEAQAAQAALDLAQAKLDDLMAGARPEEIRSAEATLKRRQATLNEARQSFERIAELYEKGFVSQDELGKAQERVEVAEADMSVASDMLSMLQSGATTTEITVQEAIVSEAAARLGLARAHLSECVITAPFGGTVSKVHVRPGDIASSREPLIEIFDPDSMVIRFDVPEAQAFAVRKGMTVRISLDAAPDKVLSAEVARIYPELDPIMRTLTIEVAIAAPAEVAPHMFARLRLNLSQTSDALVIPAEAVLVTPSGMRQLYVIEDGKAVLRSIVTGIEDGVNIEIVSGVEAGEKVAVAGGELLKPGMSVRVVQEQGTTQKRGDQGSQPGSEQGTQQ
jgi:membrane fusion protein (multidrug efflux system)